MRAMPCNGKYSYGSARFFARVFVGQALGLRRPRRPPSLAIILALAGVLNAQTISLDSNGHWYERLRQPYRAPSVRAVDYSNSARIDSLLRAGQLYLSLKDALALAVENNLDLELQRFAPRIAEADTLRAQGGGLLRGVPLTYRQLYPGVGGPGAPLLASLGAGSSASTVPSNSTDLASISQQNVDLSIQPTQALSSGSRVPSFDPAIAGTLNWGHASVPQTSSFVSGTNALLSNNFAGNLGLQQSFVTGTSYNLGFLNNRTLSNAARAEYNPYTTSALGLTVTQSLLQGWGIATNRRFIQIAKNDEKISQNVFRLQVVETVSSVIRLYWDLVSLVEDSRVKEQALGLARKLFEDNKSQVEVGTLAPLELKRAQAEVARSRQDFTNAQNLVLQQELILKTVLSRNGLSDERVRAARIVPLDHIDIPDQDRVIPMQDMLEIAFRKRPDIIQSRIQVENSRISLKGSKAALLPQLDVIASLQNNGLTGEPNTNPLAPGGNVSRVPDGFFLGGYGNALGQIFARNFPNYAVGLQLNIPIRNRVAQADVVRDQLQIRQTEVRLRLLENQIRLELETALVAMQRARSAFDAALETRQLQDEALAAEQERYTVGASTSFFVIQYQRDLQQARSTEVTAKNAYAKARAALDRSLGEILMRNGIDVEEAYRGRISFAPTPIPVDVK